jgi:uncharacterized membrane protein YbhN (UPF0104 family)
MGLGLFVWVILDATAQSQSVSWPPIPVGHLGVAFGLIFVAHGLHGAAWVVGARQIAPEIDWPRGMATYSVAFLGRYIPGKIWQVGGMVYFARQRGADTFQIAGFSLVFLVAFQLIGAALFGLALVSRDMSVSWALPVAGALAIVLAAAAFCTVFGTAVTARLPQSWNERLGASLNQPFGALAANFGFLAATWVLLATAGYYIAIGVQPGWDGTWADSSTAILGGIIAGFFVLIAPSGAGVRESAIIVLLTQFDIEPAAAIAIAIALRLAMTAGELLWALLGAVILLGSVEDEPERYET